jgi:hypothetical protein
MGTRVLFSATECPLGGWCSERFGPCKLLACAIIACGSGGYFAINAASQGDIYGCTGPRDIVIAVYLSNPPRAVRVIG